MPRYSSRRMVIINPLPTRHYDVPPFIFTKFLHFTGSLSHILTMAQTLTELLSVYKVSDNTFESLYKPQRMGNAANQAYGY